MLLLYLLNLFLKVHVGRWSSGSFFPRVVWVSGVVLKTLIAKVKHSPAKAYSPELRHFQRFFLRFLRVTQTNNNFPLGGSKSTTQKHANEWLTFQTLDPSRPDWLGHGFRLLADGIWGSEANHDGRMKYTQQWWQKTKVCWCFWVSVFFFFFF